MFISSLYTRVSRLFFFLNCVSVVFVLFSQFLVSLLAVSKRIPTLSSRLGQSRLSLLVLRLVLSFMLPCSLCSFGSIRLLATFLIGGFLLLLLAVIFRLLRVHRVGNRRIGLTHSFIVQVDAELCVVEAEQARRL